MLKLILAFLVTTISSFSYDFNSDGNDDIVFQDTITKEHKIKFMDVDGISAGILIGLENKIVVAFGDFNGDEVTDIVAKDIKTNKHTLYFMSHTGIFDTKFLGRKDFEVVSFGDFNNDGYSDIIWQNIETKVHTIYYSDMVGGFNLNFIGKKDFKVAGTGDFNADGYLDIIWQNVDNKRHSISYGDSKGSKFLGRKDFKVISTGDFNNDGYCDIIWQNIDNKRHFIAYGNSKGSKFLGMKDFRVASTGDFNGNSYTDIVWQNNETKEHHITNFDENGIIGSLYLGKKTCMVTPYMQTKDYTSKVPSTGSTLPYEVLDDTIEDGKKPNEKMEVRNGGYGSAATAHPTKTNQFYALTDRGPNATYTGDAGKGKMFPTPDYTPRIGLFEIKEDGTVSKIKDILLKDRDGNNISGLPNSSALGGTGETPYDKDGNIIVDENDDIKLDDYGLDGEGLAALKDGSFWVSDEYGPHMVHFDSNGKEIGRINAFSNDVRNDWTLPAEYANRRANRGMEGLAITPDEKTLVGIMQSTMYNPNKDVKNLDIIRIITVDLETGSTKQYLYKQEKTQNSNSEIAAISSDEFLVIERDGSFLKGGPKDADPEAQKQVYRISLSSGTELENITLKANMEQNATNGLLIDGQTLEQVVLNDGWGKLEANGVKAVEKELVVDMVKAVEYPHDKMEGLIIFNDSTLGILNDDDFATWSSGGVLEQKYLKEDLTKVDANTLYIIKDLDLKAKK